MAKFEVEVENRRRRQRKTPGRGSLHWLRAIFGHVLDRPWLLVASGLILFVYLVGTPHVGTTYDCLGSRREGGGCELYFSCNYYGIQGKRTIFPKVGERCQIVQFLPLKWGQNDEG